MKSFLAVLGLGPRAFGFSAVVVVVVVVFRGESIVSQLLIPGMGLGVVDSIAGECTISSVNPTL